MKLKNYKEKKSSFIKWLREFLKLYKAVVLKIIAYVIPFLLVSSLLSLIPVKGNLQFNISVIISAFLGIFFLISLNRNWKKNTKRIFYLSIMGITTTMGLVICTSNYVLVMNNPITKDTVNTFIQGVLICYIAIFSLWIVGYVIYLYRYEKRISWKWIVAFIPYFSGILYLRKNFNSYWSFVHSKDYDSRLVASMLIDEKMTIETLNNLHMILIVLQVIIFCVLMGGILSGFFVKKEKKRKQEES